MNTQSGEAPFSIPPLDKIVRGLSESAAIAEFSQAMELPTMVLTARDTSSPLRFLHVNEAFVSLCGYDLSEAVGETTRLLQGEDTDIDAAGMFRREVEQDGSGFTTLVNYRKDGTPYETFLLGARLRQEHDAKEQAPLLYAAFAFFIRDADAVAPRLQTEL